MEENHPKSHELIRKGHSVSLDKISSKRTWRDNWIEIPNRSPKLFSCNGDIFLFLKDVGEVVKDKILSLV